MKELTVMKNELPDGRTIYNSIISGNSIPSALNDAEISALFDYLCGELEEGRDADSELLKLCAERYENEKIGDETKIIRNTYRRLGIKHPVYSRKNFFRRTMIAVIAACVFAISCFITAFSLNIDLTEKIEGLFAHVDKDTGITFTDYRNPVDGKYAVTKYHGINRLFTTKFKDYLYPSQLPEGTKAKKASDYGEKGKTLISLQIDNENEDVFCNMTAKDASQTYLPMGYKYSAFCDGQSLEFVYTVSRRNADIVKYTLYTVYEGIQYTFHIHTGDWSEVTKIISGINLP